MNEPGINIGMREIYDEVLKNSKATADLTLRVGSIENKLTAQEVENRSFRRSLQLQVVGAVIAILVSAVTFFLFK